MQKREISRTPTAPSLTSAETLRLEQLCFGNPTALAKADVLFIFGTTHGVFELVSSASAYLKSHSPEKVIISGGVPNYVDSPNRQIPESEEIANALRKVSTFTGPIVLETAATNMQENVILSLPFLMDFLGRKIAFIGKSHGITRFGATLRKHISGELIPISFDAKFGNLLMSRSTWQHHPELKARVWGEALRLQSYGKKGDIKLTSQEELLLRSLEHHMPTAPTNP